MKVLFLGQSNNLEPWFGDVLKAVGEAHQVVLWQPGAAGPPLDNVEVVIEQGGGVVGRETIAAAATAGVRLWQVLGTGLDHVDVQYILDRGLPLANTPGPFSSVALAEHALFLMLYFAKNFPASQRTIRSGVFYRPMNDELDGATLGLIGLGASARELSRRAAAFGMRLVGLDIQPPPTCAGYPRHHLSRRSGGTGRSSWPGGLCVDPRAAHPPDPAHGRCARIGAHTATRGPDQRGARRNRRSGRACSGVAQWLAAWRWPGCVRYRAARCGQPAVRPRQRRPDSPRRRCHNGHVAAASGSGRGECPPDRGWTPAPVCRNRAD